MKIINGIFVFCSILAATTAISRTSYGSSSSVIKLAPLKHSSLSLSSLKTSQLVGQASTQVNHQTVEPKIKISPVSEALAGFVVSLATLPKAIAFSTVLGVNPLTGIWTTVAVSLAVTVIGRSPGKNLALLTSVINVRISGLISGVAGVLIMPIAAIMKTHGPHAMSAAVILSGLLEILFGVLKLGKYLDIVTENVVVGFLNAVVVFLLKTQVLCTLNLLCSINLGVILGSCV